MDFGRFGEACWEEKTSQNETKIDPQNNENLIGILEASWGDLKRQVGLQGGRG